MISTAIMAQRVKYDDIETALATASEAGASAVSGAPQKAAELRATLAKLAGLRRQVGGRKRGLEALRASVDADEGSFDDPAHDIVGEFKLVQGCGGDDAALEAQLAEASEAFEAAASGEQDDMEMVDPNRDPMEEFKCPVTGMLYDEPVRNPDCQHVYSKMGIAQVVKSKAKDALRVPPNRREPCQCPYNGCPGKIHALSALTKADDVVRKLAQAQKRAKRQKKSWARRGGDDEVDIS